MTVEWVLTSETDANTAARDVMTWASEIADHEPAKAETLYVEASGLFAKAGKYTMAGIMLACADACRATAKADALLCKMASGDPSGVSTQQEESF